MPNAYTNRTRVHFESIGSGHPVLLIPDLGYDGWFWHDVAPVLGERYQVISPDPRGTGQSAKPEGPYSVAMLAEDMAGLIDSLQCRGVYVVGHGLGAYVAQHLALERPELVAKLVLAGGDYGGPTAVPGATEARELQAVREGDSMELIERAVSLAAAPGFAQRKPQVVRQIVAYRMGDAVAADEYDAHLEALQAMADGEESFEDLLPQLEMPTLVLVGEQDSVVPPDNAKLLAERIPHAQVVTLPGVGHLFPLEDPEGTTEALIQFLGGTKYPE